jgi:hypothetical protein
VVVLILIAGLEVSTTFFFKERQSRMEAERARANEMVLQKKAAAREKITEASVLVSHGAMKEADAMSAAIPVDLLSPSREASDVFRRLGMWNLFQRKWKQSADRYLVLLQVDQVDKDDRTTQSTYDLLLAAPLLIEAGDIGDYDRMRRAELARLGNTTNAPAAEQLMKTCLLLPADDGIMKQLQPLEKVVAGALASRDPAVNGGSLLSAWRAFALSLLDYRRGDFTNAVEELHLCSSYPVQSPACVAGTHLLLSMALRQLGKNKEADAELEQGEAMVHNRFQKKLEYGDDRTGKIEGWIEAPIFLHEAESLANTTSWLESGNSE